MVTGPPLIIICCCRVASAMNLILDLEDLKKIIPVPQVHSTQPFVYRAPDVVWLLPLSCSVHVFTSKHHCSRHGRRSLAQ